MCPKRHFDTCTITHAKGQNITNSFTREFDLNMSGKKYNIPN